jgi:hypothetical protein
MRIDAPLITGSLNYNGTSLQDLSTYATTSSVNNLIQKTGSYALTGSNYFSGSQVVSGSITATGNITAQTLIIQTITSSVLFTTGSNIIGSSLSNTQQLTGSVGITGSLSVNTNGTEFQVSAGGVNIGNALTDNHIISGSLRVNPNGLFVSSSGVVGIGTSSPLYVIDAYSTGTSNARINIGGTTNFVTSQYTNTSGTMYVGIDDSAGANFTGTAYGRFIYSSGAYPLVTLINGTERMRITSAGDVGIGTTPSAWNSFTALQMANGVHLASYTSGVNILDFGYNYYFNGSAYIYTNTDAVSGIQMRAGEIRFNTAISGTAGATVPYDEKMRITNGGFLLVGNTNHTDGSMFENGGTNTALNAYRQSSTGGNGIIGFYSNVTSTKNIVAYFKCDGGLANYSGNNVNLSDERTKNSISPLDSYWDKFKAINIVKFKYNGQSHDNYNIGVIAQQVEKVAPEFVSNDGWGINNEDKNDLKAIYESDLHHATIKVLQEAMIKIETLEAEIEILKNK